MLELREEKDVLDLEGGNTGMMLDDGGGVGVVLQYTLSLLLCTMQVLIGVTTVILR